MSFRGWTDKDLHGLDHGWQLELFDENQLWMSKLILEGLNF